MCVSSYSMGVKWISWGWSISTVHFSCLSCWIASTLHVNDSFIPGFSEVLNHIADKLGCSPDIMELYSCYYCLHSWCKLTHAIIWVCEAWTMGTPMFTACTMANTLQYSLQSWCKLTHTCLHNVPCSFSYYMRVCMRSRYPQWLLLEQKWKHYCAAETLWYQLWRSRALQLFHSSCIKQKREGHEWEVDYGSVTGFHVYICVCVSNCSNPV